MTNTQIINFKTQRHGQLQQKQTTANQALQQTSQAT